MWDTWLASAREQVPAADHESARKSFCQRFPSHLIPPPPPALQNVLNPHDDSHKITSPMEVSHCRRCKMSRRLTDIQRRSQPPVQSSSPPAYRSGPFCFGCSHLSLLPPLAQVMLACKHVSKATKHLCIGCACGALPTCTSYGCRNAP